MNDNLSLRYIFGTSRYTYERITDDDSSRSEIRDNSFCVNHEMQHDSHEFQAFYDIGDNLSFTSGAFWYIMKIFYNTNQNGRTIFAVDASNDPFHLEAFSSPTVGLFRKKLS